MADAATPVGSWNIYYGDIAIYSADGTVTTIYERAPSTSFSYSSNGGETNTQAIVERSATAGDAESPAYTTTYYVADQINSSRMLLTAGGWPVSQDTYYPFGAEPYPPADANHYKFSGKERDAESGNDYFGARYYSSSMGRFLTPDWSAAPQAMPYADLGNPQSFNRYVYANNNPLGGIDADGHESDEPCGSAVGAPTPTDSDHGGTKQTSQPCDTPAAAGNPYPVDNGESAQWNSDTAQSAIQGLANSLQGMEPLSKRSQQAIGQAATNDNYDATDFENTMLGAGSRNGIDPNILVGLAFKESSLNPNAPHGGLFQIQPGLAKDLGIAGGDIWNFHIQIPKVAAVLSNSISTLDGNLDLGIASWTLGIGGTRRLFSSGGMPSVRSALLDRNHPNYGRVGSNYIDIVKGFEH